jgi:hypothetical protein
MSEQRSNALGSAAMITVEEFAALARLSRRQIDRLRRRRPAGFRVSMSSEAVAASTDAARGSG